MSLSGINWNLLNTTDDPMTHTVGAIGGYVQAALDRASQERMNNARIQGQIQGQQLQSDTSMAQANQQNQIAQQQTAQQGQYQRGLISNAAQANQNQGQYQQGLLANAAQGNQIQGQAVAQQGQYQQGMLSNDQQRIQQQSLNDSFNNYKTAMEAGKQDMANQILKRDDNLNQMYMQDLRDAQTPDQQIAAMNKWGKPEEAQKYQSNWQVLQSQGLTNLDTQLNIQNKQDQRNVGIAGSYAYQMSNNLSNQLKTAQQNLAQALQSGQITQQQAQQYQKQINDKFSQQAQDTMQKFNSLAPASYQKVDTSDPVASTAYLTWMGRQLAPQYQAAVSTPQGQRTYKDVMFNHIEGMNKANNDFYRPNQYDPNEVKQILDTGEQ